MNIDAGIIVVIVPLVMFFWGFAGLFGWLSAWVLFWILAVLMLLSSGNDVAGWLLFASPWFIALFFMIWQRVTAHARS